MNTQSSYVFSDDPNHQGLGRIASLPAVLVRNTSIRKKPERKQAPEERFVRRKPIIVPKKIIPPKPINKPTPKAKRIIRPRPVIDKNPFRPPKLIVTAAGKASKSKPRKKPTSSKSKTPPKTTHKRTSNHSKDILAGTFDIGGMQVKKTHAAMAGGGIAGGLLLWKILF